MAAGLPRVEVMPNIVDPAEAARLAAAPPSFPLPERFLLFVGKLEENKGARLLVPAWPPPGTSCRWWSWAKGSLARAVRFEAAAAGIPLLNRGWAEREDVLRTLARAEALVFPSLWPEPLSRVLLEALALGVPGGGHGHGRHRRDPARRQRPAGHATRASWARRSGGCSATPPCGATPAERGPRPRARPSRPRRWCRATRRVPAADVSA